MKKLSLVLIPTLLFSGCVTAKKYQQRDAEALAQQERAETLDGQLKKTSAERDGLKKNVDDLTLQLKANADQLAGLQKSNTDLTDSLNANKTTLSQKASALIKERDALQQDRDAVSQKLDAANLKIADLGKQLEVAQIATKALEDAKAAELEKVKKSYEDMTAGLKSEISAGQVQITQLKGKLTVNMVDQILFDTGSADLKGDGQKVLAKVGEALNKIADKDIRIEGHTDNKPLSAALQAKFPSNWELSTARATTVARYLIDHASVDPKRLVAAGYGEFKPKDSNDTPAGRAKNRRIEIVLVPRE
jgi:chemotaxis protein MotB